MKVWDFGKFVDVELVSVPYRGLSFYILLECWRCKKGYAVSVPYRGLSFYIRYKGANSYLQQIFRPLSGSFFLYYNSKYDISVMVTFPSPIGVFLFILYIVDFIINGEKVSVPYRGLSFYIQLMNT